MRALRLKAKTQDDLIEAVKARLGGDYRRKCSSLWLY